MATFYQDGDPGCTSDNWIGGAGSGGSGDPASFNPLNLDTDQWASSMVDLGAKHAVLTAKHGCGHLLWPTQVTLPNGDDYTYCVGKENSSYDGDLLAKFTESMDRAGIGHGFYYSLTNNFFLDVQSHSVQNSTLLPGQQLVTQEEFEAIALGHVEELWSNYGDLTEIWWVVGGLVGWSCVHQTHPTPPRPTHRLDGGYTTDMKDAITELLEKLQPNAGVFGGGTEGCREGGGGPYRNTY